MTLWSGLYARLCHAFLVVKIIVGGSVVYFFGTQCSAMCFCQSVMEVADGLIVEDAWQPVLIIFYQCHVQPFAILDVAVQPRSPYGTKTSASLLTSAQVIYLITSNINNINSHLHAGKNQYNLYAHWTIIIITIESNSSIVIKAATLNLNIIERKLLTF